mmetsp:Transcript_15565/g.24330  ORF Transcript_15565/g.24330 Transcript_15565/m.24330 type:complete len:142 (-) Transcript_15565:720-1145(-)
MHVVFLVFLVVGVGFVDQSDVVAVVVLGVVVLAVAVVDFVVDVAGAVDVVVGVVTAAVVVFVVVVGKAVVVVVHAVDGDVVDLVDVVDIVVVVVLVVVLVVCIVFFVVALSNWNKIHIPNYCLIFERDHVSLFQKKQAQTP